MAFGQIENGTAALLRKLHADNAALQSEILKIQTRLESSERKLAEMASTKERPWYIEDIPGKRVPYWANITIDIAASSTARVSGTYTVSQDGPFVATTLMAAFRPTGSSATAINRWRMPSSVEPEIEVTAGTFGNDYLDFLWEVEDSGSNRQRQNRALPSSYLANGRVNLSELGVADFFERSSVITVYITPIRTLATNREGTLHFTLVGFKLLISQAFSA